MTESPAAPTLVLSVRLHFHVLKHWPKISASAFISCW